MAYTVHNFQAGHKLTETDLNQMDAQIALQEEHLDSLQALLDSQDSEVKQKIYKLSLETDEENAYLFYGDEQLAEIELPTGVSNIVPCTSLSLTSGSPIDMTTEETKTITASRQPNNCNQGLRFLSSNIDKLTISNGGVITPLVAGRESITVLCGSQKINVPVNISQRFTPVGKLFGHMYKSGNGYLAKYTVDTRGEVCFDESENLIVPPGYTVNVAISGSMLTSPMAIGAFVILKPREGGFTTTTWGDGTIAVQNMDCIFIGSKSEGNGVSLGGSDKNIGTYDYAESESWTNETDSNAYLILSIKIYTPYDAETGRNLKVAEQSDIAKVLNQVSITIIPAEGGD